MGLRWGFGFFPSANTSGSVSGTGATGQVAVFNGTSSITSTANLTFSAGVLGVAGSVRATNTDGTSFMQLAAQASTPAAPLTPPSAVRVFANSAGEFAWLKDSGFVNILASSASADRTYTLPDASGTFPLGTGAANRVVYWSGTNAQTSSANFTFDGTNVLTVAGTVSGSTALTLRGGTASGNDLTLTSTSHATKGIIYLGSAQNLFWASEASLRIFLSNQGNVTVGTTSNDPAATFGIKAFNSTGDSVFRIQNTNSLDIWDQKGNGDIAVGGKFVTSVYNVRINVTTASADLHIKHAVATANEPVFKIDSFGDAEILYVYNHGNISTKQIAQNTGSPTYWSYTAAAHTTLDALTEAIDINFNLARTVQFATGALTTQRAYLIQAPTYAFVGASTLTNAATLAISAAPTAGTNATITNTYAFWVQAGAARFDGRVLGTQGADVASANDLTLGADGNAFEITGTTQINAITLARWQNGSIVNLLFTSTPTVKYNTAGSAGTAVILLAGATDFVASAGDTLTLLLSEIGGTQAWREIGRAVI